MALKKTQMEKNIFLEILGHQEKKMLLILRQHFNLFIDQNVIHSFCLEANRYANQYGVAGFQDVVPEEMTAFVAMNIAMGILNTSDVKTFGLQTQFFHILSSLQ